MIVFVINYLRKNDRVELEIDYSLGTFVFVENPPKFIDLEIPLIGFSEVDDNLVKELMNKEGITHQDFIIKQVPELTLEGEMRPVMVDVREFKILEKCNDWVKISFTLPKGSYATMVVKKLFG